MSKLRECLLVWQSNKEPDEEEKADLGANWDLEEGEETFWNVLAFDGVMRETINGSSTVTSYPIDRGFLISDSVIRNNRLITLETVSSNMSYKVSVRRKDFDESFTELLTTIGMVQNKKKDAEGTIEKLLDMVGLYDGGPGDYPDAIKHGRAKFDNDEITLDTPFGSVSSKQLGKIGNGIATTLAAQISDVKVDNIVETVDELCGKGVRLHLISLRGVRKDCAITSFSVSNDKTNAHSAPMVIELTQMQVHETVSAVSPLLSDASASEGAEVNAEAQIAANAPTQKFSNPSPMSYFAAGFAFRGMAVTEADIKQNPVRLESDSRKVGDKRYFDTTHKEIKISDKRDFYLSYKGVDYVFGQIKYNDAMDAFTTSLSWNDGGKVVSVGEFPLTVGVNLVSQYGTNFESLVVVNVERAGEKIRNIKEMKLLIIVDYENYYL